MTMKETLDVLNAMEADGIIGRYAIAGAVAAYNYIEPTLTEDLDILVAFESGPARMQSGLITLAPVFGYLKTKGYGEYRKEGVVIAGWPVQFLPVANELDAEALAEAAEIEISTDTAGTAVRTRVLLPHHLVAIALRVGRPKDHIRITQFLEEGAVDIKALCELLVRYSLDGPWRSFCDRLGIPNPCDPQNPL